VKGLAAIALLAAYVSTSSYGLYLLKSSEMFKVPFAIGFVLYGLGAAIWILILRLYPLSFAFPVAAGALMLATTLIGVFILGEAFTTQNLVGTLLIASGMLVLVLKLGK
jgi:multidrug transporter EmrE-like cation transporter